LTAAAKIFREGTLKFRSTKEVSLSASTSDVLADIAIISVLLEKRSGQFEVEDMSTAQK
jgi:hypothetical protein